MAKYEHAEEVAEDEADYCRLSTRDLVTLAERGDDEAVAELERRRSLLRD